MCFYEKIDFVVRFGECRSDSSLITAGWERSEMMKRALVLIFMVGLGFLFSWAVSEDSSQQQAKLKSLKTELLQLKPDIEKTESERSALEIKIALVEQDCNKLQEQVDELTDSRKKLLKQVEELTFSREQSQQQLAEIIEVRDKFKQRVAELTDSRDMLQMQLTAITPSRNQLHRQIDELTRSRDAAVAKAQIAQERVEILLALVDSETKGFRELQDQNVFAVTSRAKEDTQPPVIKVSDNPDVLAEINWPPVVSSEAGERPTCQSFNTTRPRIMPGQSSTLSWQVSNADRVRIEPGIGSVSALGSRVINPSTTTTYTLIAVNNMGESRRSCRVEINGRITIFSTDAIHPRVLLEKDTASGDHKVLPEQEPQVSDSKTTLGKFLGYRARKDESGKFVFIPIYENKQEE